MVTSSCNSPDKGHERRKLFFLADLTFTLTIEFIYPTAAAADPFPETRTGFFCLPLWTEDSLPGILSAFAARLVD